jgi:hypothetical protein
MQHARTVGPFASEPGARGKHEFLEASDTADLRGPETILKLFIPQLFTRKVRDALDGSPTQTAGECVQR